jgi:hypothetical protein
MSTDLFQEIEIELSLLHKLFETFSLDIKKYRQQAPTEFEMSALGAILQAFYNGVEKIFFRILVNYDGNFGKSDLWHIELLERMMTAGNARPTVISQEMGMRLKQYLSFRHVFRNIYGFDLHWEKMKETVLSSEETFTLLEAEVRFFMKKMQGQ